MEFGECLDAKQEAKIGIGHGDYVQKNEEGVNRRNEKNLGGVHKRLKQRRIWGTLSVVHHLCCVFILFFNLIYYYNKIFTKNWISVGSIGNC